MVCMSHYRLKQAFYRLYKTKNSGSVSYCVLIPGGVRWPFEDHTQETGSQETDHRKQTNIFPKIFVQHWRAPFEHDFNIIQEAAVMENISMRCIFSL